jgi:putative phage-type endonuclease
MVWTRNLSNEEQLLWRSKGIGGSDAAAISGANPYKSKVEVFLEKVGGVPEKMDNETMRMGRSLKDFIAKEFMDRTNHRTFRRHAIFQHSRHKFMLATIDRWIVHQHCGLLCKNTSEYMKDEWDGDEVPERIKLQCQHYMAVTDAKQWFVAVLIGGNKLKWAQLQRDNGIINELIEREQDFWEKHVLANKQPAYDGSIGSGDLLNRLYPQAERGSAVELPKHAETWFEQFKQAEKEERIIVERKNEAGNKLKNLLGQSEYGIVGNHTVTWRNVRARGMSESGHRRFIIK